MTVIDQRILIAASVEYVWVYLAEPAYVSKWNRRAKQMSMLTARAEGVGMRRRCVDTHGQSVVEEVTAWLPPYGYEYHVVDGPYRSFTGRLRLQSVPDGTQIQWLVDYELRGFLSGLRNQFGHQRRLRVQLADSLRGLRRLIEASGVRLDREKQAKVAMQADPGFAARLARSADPTRQSGVLSLPPEAIITVGDDDLPELPPEPVVSMPTTPGMPQPAPSLPTSIPTTAPATGKTKPLNEKRPEPLVDDTKPRPPAGLREALATIRPASAAAETPPTPASGQTTVSAALVAPRPIDPTTQTVLPMPRVSAAMPANLAPAVAPPAAASSASPTPPSQSTPADLPLTADKPIAEGAPALDTADKLEKPEKHDTGEMSIWDVFGVDRPSERNKVQLDEVIASLQTPLPGALPPVDLPPLIPKKLTSEASSTPPPPQFEPMHAIWGQFVMPAPTYSGKATVAVRRAVAPKHAKTTVSVRRNDR